MDFLISIKNKLFGPNYTYQDLINEELNKYLSTLSKGYIKDYIEKGTKIDDKHLRKIAKHKDVEAIQYVLQQYKGKIDPSILSMTDICNQYYHGDWTNAEIEKRFELFKDKLYPTESTYSHCKTFNIFHNIRLREYINNRMLIDYSSNKVDKLNQILNSSASILTKEEIENLINKGAYIYKNNICSLYRNKNIDAITYYLEHYTGEIPSTFLHDVYYYQKLYNKDAIINSNMLITNNKNDIIKELDNYNKSNKLKQLCKNYKSYSLSDIKYYIVKNKPNITNDIYEECIKIKDKEFDKFFTNYYNK